MPYASVPLTFKKSKISRKKFIQIYDYLNGQLNENKNMVETKTDKEYKNDKVNHDNNLMDIYM